MPRATDPQESSQRSEDYKQQTPEITNTMSTQPTAAAAGGGDSPDRASGSYRTNHLHDGENDPNYVPDQEEEEMQQQKPPQQQNNNNNASNTNSSHLAAPAPTADGASSRKQQNEQRRVIYCADPSHPEHKEQKFASNFIKTTKYTVIPFFLDFFLWKMLYEQFKRLANWYFLLIGCLQMIPGISPTGRFTTISTLVSVLTFSMCKSGYEDYQRHKKDNEVNGRKTFVYKKESGTWEETSYVDIAVGDLVRVMNVDRGDGSRDNNIPCDLCVLTTSDPDGVCYVETANLDGETNLKARRSLDATKINLWVDPNAEDDGTHMSPGSNLLLSSPDGGNRQISGDPSLTPTRQTGGGSSSADYEQQRSNSMLMSSSMVYDEEELLKSEKQLQREEAARLRQQALNETEDLLPVMKEKGYTSIYLETEQPNNQLYTFNGKLKLSDGQMFNLSPDQMLYRGCLLRKVHWVVGVAIFTGRETKVMMNARKPPHKASRVERIVNKVLISILILELCICIVAATFSAVGDKSQWYLQQSEFNSIDGISVFATMLILFNNLIPISLYVSLEFIKFFQGRLMEQDLTIYYAPRDMKASAKTTDLNEELGQVSYVFSDKTGTLTRNVMTFMKFSVGDQIFGSGTTEIGKAAAKRQGKVVTDDRPKDVLESDFPFWDAKLDPTKVHMRTDARIIQQLFEVLAVCHTVVVDAGKYEAESPDEEALVKAAGKFGFDFANRTTNTLTLNTGTGSHKAQVLYEILEVIEFNSTRKRMSVVVRNTKTKKLSLFTKGADNVMFARLAPGTDTDFTQKALKQFGEEGLRTLVIGKRDLELDELKPWLQEYRDAKGIIGDDKQRSALMEDLSERIERDLELVGTTAIEDKLQLGVPQTVEALRTAGLKVWMLTGDKVETAVNIGFACALLHTNMNILMACDPDATASTLQEKLSSLKAVDDGTELALTIDGDSLTTIFSDKKLGLADLLYEVTQACTSVICCRVSPKQKAEIVELVRKRADGAITLSIGDGANDVPMIQAAHVGIGISGMEGQQAANAADYSIGQFRYLHRLVMVHGRVNYHRLCLVINYFFYKNALLVFSQFFYAIFNLWTGQSLYEQWTLVGYNVGFTAMPCIAVGIFDRDILSTDNVHEYPQIYRAGLQDELFNIKVFLQWIFNAILHSAVCYFCVFYGWTSKMGTDGHIMALDGMGVTLYTCIIVVATCKLAIHSNSFSWMQHFTLWGSIILYFVFLAIYGQMPASLSSTMYQILQNVGFNLAPWLFFFVVTLIALSRDFFWQIVLFRLLPIAQVTVRRLIQLKDSRDAKADTRPPKELTMSYEGDSSSSANNQNQGDQNQQLLFTNAEIGETDINPSQDFLLQFFDADLEEKFIRGYLGDLQRYKLGTIFALVGSLVVTVSLLLGGSDLISVIMWAILAATSLVFLLMLYCGAPSSKDGADSTNDGKDGSGGGSKKKGNEELDEDFNQHSLKPFLHPIMCLLLFINFSCMSVAFLLSAREESDVHPLTYGLILLGLLTVVRPPLLHALHYVGISFVCFISWYQVIPVDDWDVPEVVLRLVELTIISATALIALASSEVFLRDMFVSQQTVSQRRKVAALEEMRSLRLLGNVLPTAIVNEVRRNHRQLSQFSVTYEEASLLNSDIVKFTNFSSAKEPHVVVEMLNLMFTKFDFWARKLGLEKIKTIGDAYICAGGIPIPDILHREKIVAMGVSMVGSVQEMCHDGIPSLKELNIQIRVGTASGPVRAGVVGMQKVCYDIFGHTADESERMESSGLPDRVQVSPALFKGLRESKNYTFTLETVPHPEHGEQFFIAGDAREMVDKVIEVIERNKAIEAQVPYHDLEREDVYAFLEDEDHERRLLNELWSSFDGATSLCSLKFNENDYAEEDFRVYYRDIAFSHALPELYTGTIMFFINTLLVGLFVKEYTDSSVLVLAAVFLIHFIALIIVKIRQFRKEVERTGGEDGDEIVSAEEREKKRIEQRLTRARSDLRMKFAKSEQDREEAAVEKEREQNDEEEASIRSSMVVARVLAFLSGTVALFLPLGIIFLLGQSDRVKSESIGTVSVFLMLSSSIYVLSFLHLRIMWKALIVALYWILSSLAFFYNQALVNTFQAASDGGDYLALVLCFLLTLLAAYNVEASVRKAFAAAKGLVAENADVDSAVALCDKLLNNVLPRSIVRRMKLRPDRQVVDEVEDASALFIYMDGLIADGEGKDAVQTISEMNDVLFILDELCMRHRVEKIKTTPFLVVSGCPEKNPFHCEHLAAFAHDVVLNVENYNVKNRKSLKIKIGLHTGKVTAGVLGTTKFLYDVFGDTVNFASRLTSSASWNSIQLSEASANRLQGKANFNVKHKGNIMLKGKGAQEVYILEPESLATSLQANPTVRPIQSRTGSRQSSNQSSNSRLGSQNNNNAPTEIIFNSAGLAGSTRSPQTSPQGRPVSPQKSAPPLPDSSFNSNNSSSRENSKNNNQRPTPTGNSKEEDCKDDLDEKASVDSI